MSHPSASSQTRGQLDGAGFLPNLFPPEPTNSPWVSEDDYAKKQSIEIFLSGSTRSLRYE